MDIMHAKRKAAIFTLSRQQKITPNCKGWGGLCGLRARGGGCWEAGRLASKCSPPPPPPVSLCTCVRADHQELLNPGFVLFRQ